MFVARNALFAVGYIQVDSIKWMQFGGLLCMENGSL